MNRFQNSRHQRRNPLGYILLAGFFIGLALSILLYGGRLSGTGKPLAPIQTPAPLLQPILTATQVSGAVQPRSLVTLSGNAGSSSLLPKVGDPAPDFSLQTLAGENLSLAEFNGKPVLINYWASWCQPCRVEMPEIETAYQTYKNQGLVVLGINDTHQDDLAEVKSFVNELKLSFPILLDQTGEVTESRYGVIGLPTSVFIDRQGVIRFIQIGAMTTAQLENNLKTILQ